MSGLVKAAALLSELTASSPSFVRLDPPGANADVAALAPIWEAAASQLPRVGVLTVACETRAALCDHVAPDRLDGDVTFAVWSVDKFVVYRGTRDAENLVSFLRSFVGSFGEGAAGRGSSAEGRTATEPEDLQTLLQAGMRDFDESKDTWRLERGVSRPEFNDDLPASQLLLSMIGRAKIELNTGPDYERARGYFERAAASSATPIRDCARLQHATALESYPANASHRDVVLSRFHHAAAALLRASDVGDPAAYKYRFRDPAAAALDLSGVTHSDAWVFCVLTPFFHSFYAYHDPRGARAGVDQHIRLALRAFPHLNYTAPHLRPSPSAAAPSCRERGGRVRLGVASAFLSPRASVLQDFGGVLRRLPRASFEITFVHIDEAGHGDLPFLDERRRAGDGVITVRRQHGGEEVSEAWLPRAREEIGALQLDLLLYLDLTMSPFATRLAMSRLARVQATSHGHPLTSGLWPRARGGSLDYYISWAAAELAPAVASAHYTEELALLPAHTMHQFYEHNYEAASGASGGAALMRSRYDGQPFSHLTRADFGGHVPAEGHWYVCMQKPFKRFPELDALLVRLLAANPAGRLLLHEATHETNQRVLAARLHAAGADMSRVHFLPEQPHHRLLALYRLSDAVLDSYSAGGCTTTREALALGAPVVTLPAKLLGGRWSLAYYSIMGVGELVARDEDEYVAIAARLGADPAWRREVKRRVRANVHKLYGRTEAVDAWATLLRRLADDG